MSGEAPHPSPIDLDDDPGGSNLLGLLLSLGGAAVAGALLLRALIDSESVSNRVTRVATPPAEDSLPIADTLLPLPPTEARPVLVLRHSGSTTPEPWQFASIAEAGRLLGFSVVVPSSLPEGLFLQTVRWQFDNYPLVPGQSFVGVLQAWFASDELGGVFVLEQGPGIGVSDFAAPAGVSGVVQLSDGRRLIWVRGHRLRSDNRTGGGGWGGTELRLGVRATGGRGWRLITRTLTLEELVAIAEGLR